MKTTQDTRADVFTAIAHPVRRQILDYLRGGDLTVKWLANQFNISRPAISQHLAILLDVHLVARYPSGRERYYKLQAEGLQAVSGWVLHYEHFWNQRLDRLSDYLDKTNND